MPKKSFSAQRKEAIIMFFMLLVTDQQFSQLYRKYIKYAGTVCINTMKRYFSKYFSLEETKDILQETFLNTYLYLVRTEEIHNMKSLIARITELTTIKHMDKYVRLMRVKLPMPEVEEDPIEIVLETEDLERLAKVIKTLHPRFSSVLLLKDFHGMSLKGIAEISGIPYNTILSWHSRGKRQLAKLLQEKYSSEGLQPKDLSEH